MVAPRAESAAPLRNLPRGVYHKRRARDVVKRVLLAWLSQILAPVSACFFCLCQGGWMSNGPEMLGFFTAANTICLMPSIWTFIGLYAGERENTPVTFLAGVGPLFILWIYQLEIALEAERQKNWRTDAISYYGRGPSACSPGSYIRRRFCWDMMAGCLLNRDELIRTLTAQHWEYLPTREDDAALREQLPQLRRKFGDLEFRRFITEIGTYYRYSSLRVGRSMTGGNVSIYLLWQAFNMHPALIIGWYVAAAACALLLGLSPYIWQRYYRRWVWMRVSEHAYAIHFAVLVPIMTYHWFATLGYTLLVARAKRRLVHFMTLLANDMGSKSAELGLPLVGMPAEAGKDWFDMLRFAYSMDSQLLQQMMDFVRRKRIALALALLPFTLVAGITAAVTRSLPYDASSIVLPVMWFILGLLWLLDACQDSLRRSEEKDLPELVKNVTEGTAYV